MNKIVKVFSNNGSIYGIFSNDVKCKEGLKDFFENYSEIMISVSEEDLDKGVDMLMSSGYLSSENPLYQSNLDVSLFEMNLDEILY